MIIVYKIILNMAYLLCWPYLAIKTAKCDEWGQRRVINPEIYLPLDTCQNKEITKNNLLWLHASSVGEVKVLERLIIALKNTDKKFDYCISTYTKTGQELARAVFPDARSVFYFPLDCYFPLKRLFNKFKPMGIVIVETEIWPYFLAFCRKNNIPILLANGRLSEKSLKGYRLFKSSLSRLFSIYRKFIVQTKTDAARMEAIGAKHDKILVGGNIKHDRNNNDEQSKSKKTIRETLGIDNQTTFFIAASTRSGEEEQICEAMKRINRHSSNFKLLIAPRHLERIGEVKGIIGSYGYSYVLYSELGEGKHIAEDIILMDSMGVLADLFCGADIAFVGGTLTDIGGHNIMEPVLAGIPVIFGPSLDNVREASKQILSQNWGTMIENGKSMAETLIQFISGSLKFKEYAANNESVADMTAEIIVKEFGL
ncbi:MAG: glycosyltransferase N-terminal domain-containing protein [Candidatus Zixiibacteriota bacterium]